MTEWLKKQKTLLIILSVFVGGGGSLGTGYSILNDTVKEIKSILNIHSEANVEELTMEIRRLEDVISQMNNGMINHIVKVCN